MPNIYLDKMGIAAADLVLQVSGFLEWTPSMVAAWLIFLSGPQSAVYYRIVIWTHFKYYDLYVDDASGSVLYKIKNNIFINIWNWWSLLAYSYWWKLCFWSSFGIKGNICWHALPCCDLWGIWRLLDFIFPLSFSFCLSLNSLYVPLFCFTMAGQKDLEIFLAGFY